MQPVDTEFGRKTRIDQTSCNTDYSCLDGDCPSFVTVAGAGAGARAAPSRGRARRRGAAPIPPAARSTDAYDVFLAGIGGTGIVTVNQVLATAALLDGLDVARPRPDRAVAEGRAGHVAPALRRGAGRAGQPGQRRGSADCRPRLRPARRPPTPRTSPAPAGARPSSVVSTSQTPTGAMVVRRRRSGLPRRGALPPDPARPRACTTARRARPPREALFGRPTPRTCCCSAPRTRPARCRFRPAPIERGHRAQRRGGRGEHRRRSAGGGSRSPTPVAFATPRCTGRTPACLRSRTCGLDGSHARAARLGGLAARGRRSSSTTGTSRPRARYVARGASGLAGRAGGRRSDRFSRGRRPRTVQAHRLQGRVRGRAAADRSGARSAEAAAAAGARRLTYNLHPPTLRSAGMEASSSSGLVPAGAQGCWRRARACAARRWTRSAGPAYDASSGRWWPTTPRRSTAAGGDLDAASYERARASSPTPPSWSAATRTSSCATSRSTSGGAGSRRAARPRGGVAADLPP